MRVVSDEMVLTRSAGGTAIECSLVDDKPQARLEVGLLIVWLTKRR